MSPEAKEEEDYATRLRRAKEEAWKRRQQQK
jgi:hypothetical protein